MNAVTATILEKAFIPIVLPDERSCIRALVATCWADGPPRIAQIRSSARLDRIRVTAPLLEELRSREMLLDERPLAPLRFDGDRLARIGRR